MPSILVPSTPVTWSLDKQEDHRLKDMWGETLLAQGSLINESFLADGGLGRSSVEETTDLGI